MQENSLRNIIREVLKELYNESSYKNNFVGIHCSPKLFNDDYDGRIIDEYYSSFKSILEIIQNDYPDAKKYLDQIDLFDDGLDLYGDSVDLVFDIESFFADNNIEWIYVATEALTKYGDNCYNVYFSNLNDVYKMDDELVDNATIYIYNSSNNKPILKKTYSESYFNYINNKLLSEEVNSEFYSFNLSDEELRKIAKWGLEGDYSTSGCWDDSENLEDAIDCAVVDFKQFLSKPYPIGFGNIPRNLVVYRFLRLKSIDDLDKNNLGYSWFSNPEQYKISGFFDMLDYLKPWKTDKGEIYLIKAQTLIDNIDVPNTLWQRSTQWIENEIVLKNPSISNIKILNIKKASDLK